MLIECPECKHRVSETALSCPLCGFNIKQFVDNNKQEEERQQQEEFINKKIEEEIWDYEQRVRLPYPPKHITKEEIHQILIFLVIGAIFLLFFFAIWKTDKTQYILLICFFAASAIVFSRIISIIVYSVGRYKKELRSYNMILKDPEQYRTEKVNKYREWLKQHYAEQEENKRSGNSYNAHIRGPICPKCGSREFTPVARKYSFWLSHATAEIEYICNKCGTKMKK